MKIVIDENMPYAADLFAQLGEVVALPGRQLNAEDLIDVDALMIRSVTKVDEGLISKANKLKFVGTATAGTDHVDDMLLYQRGITFYGAAGCNKVGVAEYVLSSLLVLAQQQGFSLFDRTVGIVGAGNVGSYLETCLSALNIKTVLCDPLKEAAGDPRQFVDIDTLIATSDIISLHTPMTQTGDYATHHLIDEARLAAMSSGTILINAARGPVVDNQALKSALKSSNEASEQGAVNSTELPPLTAVLDVFEHEPSIDLDLLPYLAFATPHIAGYGLEGKARGTTMVFNAFASFMAESGASASSKSTDKSETIDNRLHADPASLLPISPVPKIELGQPIDQSILQSIVQLIYDVRRDDSEFRRAIASCQGDQSKIRTVFDQLRKNYWDRREYSAITVAGDPSFGLESLANLGFTVEDVLDEPGI